MPRLTIVFVFFSVLLNMIGFGVAMPVMPSLLMDVTGEGLARAASWGGMLSLAYAMMQFIAMPILGALSDHYGRRPIMLIALAAYTADFLITAIAPSIAYLFVARLLAGSFAATSSVASAYIADLVPPDRRAAGFGLIGAAFGLGFVIGPVLGGVLGQEWGPRAPFLFVAALGGANLIFGLFSLPESLRVENRRAFDWRRANALGSFAGLRQYPVILPISAVIFLGQIAQWSLPAVWSYFAVERFNWTPTDIGFSLMAVGLGAALVQGFVIRSVVARVGERAAAFAGLTISMVVYLGYSFAREGWTVYALIVVGALSGLTLPSLQSIMSRALPANSQGELQGAVGALNGLAMIIGPFLATQVFSAFVNPGRPFALGPFVILEKGAPAYFPGAPFCLASVLVLCSLVVLYTAFARERLGAKATPADSRSP